MPAPSPCEVNAALVVAANAAGNACQPSGSDESSGSGFQQAVQTPLVSAASAPAVADKKVKLELTPSPGFGSRTLLSKATGMPPLPTTAPLMAKITPLSTVPEVTPDPSMDDLPSEFELAQAANDCGFTDVADAAKAVKAEAEANNCTLQKVERKQPPAMSVGPQPQPPPATSYLHHAGSALDRYEPEWHYWKKKRGGRVDGYKIHVKNLPRDIEELQVRVWIGEDPVLSEEALVVKVLQALIATLAYSVRWHSHLITTWMFLQ